jgi:hypothetical protein
MNESRNVSEKLLVRDGERVLEHKMMAICIWRENLCFNTHVN